MKRLKTLPVTAVLGFALLTSACDDGLADINDNPNAPTDVPAQYLLPQAIQSTVQLIHGSGFGLEFSGLFAQHWAKFQYPEEDNYDLRPQTIQSWWDSFYASSLRDWQLIVQKGEATNRANQQATGMVMRAYTFQVMTDTWGDIPYSEALQADAETPITTPVYDTQEDIYNGLLTELEAALALFDPAAAAPWGNEDLIYGGDVASWERFANSLRLRLAMRMSDVDATTAQQVVEAVVAHPAGVIDENSESALLNYLDTPPNQNPLFENRASRDDHAVSATLVDLMSDLNDPRLGVYAALTSDGVYRGQENSGDIVDDWTLISRIGDYWRDRDNPANATRPALIMTAAEVHFLLAEAALKGFATGGTAAEHYVDGVTAALSMYDGANGITIGATEIADYLAEPGVAVVGTPTLEQIIEQKWLALYTYGHEAWAEYRRTGFPDEVTPGPGALYDFVPGRIPYPNLEQSLNGANWQAAVDRQGTGDYTGGLWWDPEHPS